MMTGLLLQMHIDKMKRDKETIERLQERQEFVIEQHLFDERIKAMESANYGRDAIDVEARVVPDNLQIEGTKP